MTVLIMAAVAAVLLLALGGSLGHAVATKTHAGRAQRQAQRQRLLNEQAERLRLYSEALREERLAQTPVRLP